MAVAPLSRMKVNGAKNVRLVIGRRAQASRMTHAWLEWKTTNGTDVLDPTLNHSAKRADDIGNRSYVPFYAYAGVEKFRAAGAVVAQNGSRRAILLTRRAGCRCAIFRIEQSLRCGPVVCSERALLPRIVFLPGEMCRSGDVQSVL